MNIWQIMVVGWVMIAVGRALARTGFPTGSWLSALVVAAVCYVILRWRGETLFPR